MRRSGGVDQAVTADPDQLDPGTAAKGFSDNHIVLTVLLNRIVDNFEKQIAALENGSDVTSTSDISMGDRAR
jgi:hypothetical protein